jgi:hypothetical protein
MAPAGVSIDDAIRLAWRINGQTMTAVPVVQEFARRYERHAAPNRAVNATFACVAGPARMELSVAKTNPDGSNRQPISGLFAAVPAARAPA